MKKALVLATVTTVLAPVALAVGSPADPFASPALAYTSCRPVAEVVSTGPNSTTALPNGAEMRIWDGGSPRLRLVAVSIPRRALNPRVLTSSSLTRTSTPATQAATSPGAVVVVNGGVFNTGSGLPHESVVRGNIVVKSGSERTNSIAITKTGDLTFSGNKASGTATVRGKKLTVRGINQPSIASGGVTVFTKGWGTKRRPSATGGIVVRGGIVMKVGVPEAARKPIPTGAVVLLANGTVGRTLAKSKPGQRVALTYGAAVEYYKAAAQPVAGTPWRYLMGNSSRIVRHGTVPSGLCTAQHEKRRQRTAVGLKPNGDILVVTATSSGVGGASTHQMGTYLRQLGAEDAVKLDGGGSTTMLVRTTLGGALTRVDTTGNPPQRKVANSLAFDALRP